MQLFIGFSNNIKKIIADSNEFPDYSKIDKITLIIFFFNY